MLGDNMLTAKLNNQLIDLTGLSRNEIIQKHQNHLLTYAHIARGT